MDIPGEPAPWLHPHPSEQELHGYYGPVRQRAPPLVLNTFGFCLGTLPLATLEAYDPGRRIDARLLTFRARAADQAHAASTPGTAWPGTRAPTRLIPKDTPEPPVSMPSQSFDASTAHARPRSPPAERFLERLPGPHLTRSLPRRFPGRSPRQSSANAAPGRFDACPRRAGAGGPTILHLLHSSAYMRGLLHGSSFSVRDTRCGSFGVTVGRR